MKTITEILNEMILKNKKEIELQKIIIEKLIKRVNKTTLTLSISIILNSITIIILNFWR